MTAPIWRKSSRSVNGTSAECVEVADLGIAVGVRDSKSPHGPRLALSPTAWRTFTKHIKTDRLDLP